MSARPRYPCSALEASYGCDCGACACGGDDGDDDCEDTDGGAADPYGDDCAAYYHYPDWCGGYDDSDFTSNEMCCACGGGVEEGAPTPAPSPRPTAPTPAPSAFSCGPSCFGQTCGYWEERG